MAAPAADALLTFAKPSVLGTVKTRLAPSLGEDGALALHEALLADAVARLERLRPRMACYLYLAAEALGHWPAGLAVRRQKGRDLGERLVAAFREAFSRGHTRVVVVGIDSPVLPDARIYEAFSALHRDDLAVGPCTDGGYYLVGLSAPRPELFHGIEWGESTVCAETVARARDFGLSVAELPPSFDVDRPEDLPVLAASLRDGAAPWALQTRVFMESRC